MESDPQADRQTNTHTQADKHNDRLDRVLVLNVQPTAKVILSGAEVTSDAQWLYTDAEALRRTFHSNTVYSENSWVTIHTTVSLRIREDLGLRGLNAQSTAKVILL